MRCGGCGTELRSTARYCDRCGGAVSPSPTETGRVRRLHDSASTPNATVAESFWYAPATSTAPSPVATSAPAPREKTERLRVLSPAPTMSAMDKVAGARAGSVAPKSAFVDTPVNVSVTPQRRRYPILSSAVLLVVAALGVAAFRLRQHEESVVAPEEATATVVATATATEVADAEDRGLRRYRPAPATTATQDREPTMTPSTNSLTPSRPKPPTPTAPSGAAVPPVAQHSNAQNPTREGSAAPSTSAPALALHGTDVAAAVPTPATPEPPVAPFFETKDVNESPIIKTRVEPRVPKALKAGSTNEIVVVRALVSQSGRPSRISLLRRTKAGPELDTVVVAAVNQWTFAPATKKGKAVSCWFNFGVEVHPAE